jgi:hypothetical protein
VERVEAKARDIWDAAEKRQPGSGDATVRKFLDNHALIASAVLGQKYAGTDKSVEHEKIIQDEIKSRTSMIDQKLQQPNLKPEERAKHLARRKEIEQGIRADFANRFPQSAGTATGGAADPLGIR